MKEKDVSPSFGDISSGAARVVVAVPGENIPAVCKAMISPDIAVTMAAIPVRIPGRVCQKDFFCSATKRDFLTPLCPYVRNYCIHTRYETYLKDILSYLEKILFWIKF